MSTLPSLWIRIIWPEERWVSIEQPPREPVGKMTPPWEYYCRRCYTTHLQSRACDCECHKTDPPLPWVRPVTGNAPPRCPACGGEMPCDFCGTPDQASEHAELPPSAKEPRS